MLLTTTPMRWVGSSSKCSLLIIVWNVLICTAKSFWQLPSPRRCRFLGCGSQVKKIIFGRNCMKCSDHQNKVIFPSSAPWGWGWSGDEFKKYLLLGIARNVLLSTLNSHSNHHCHEGTVGSDMSSEKNNLLGIARNALFWREVMFAIHHPHGCGDAVGIRDQFQNTSS